MKLSMTHVKILCLGFSAALIMACPAATPTVSETNLSGSWLWKSSLESSFSTGSCPMEDTVRQYTVNIIHLGNAVSLTGVGAGADSLTGIVGASNGGGSVAEMYFHGSYALGTGRTIDSASSVVSVDPGYTSMSGYEVWSWTGGLNSCHGRSFVTATKLP